MDGPMQENNTVAFLTAQPSLKVAIVNGWANTEENNTVAFLTAQPSLEIGHSQWMGQHRRKYYCSISHCRQEPIYRVGISIIYSLIY
jgi:hypothetical protein